MQCLDELMIARLLDRELTPDETAHVVRHLDACDECRRVVSALARGQVGVDGIAVASSALASFELTSFAIGFAPAVAIHALDAAPADDEPVPKRVGRYELTKRLGFGAMGEVYAARDPELGREIAIKVLHLGSGASNMRDRMLREAKALAKVSHPNVIAVYDVGTVDDDRLFIAMELMRGGTLREWLAKPRTVDDIVRVMASVGLGLAAAHAAGVIHRDVKPDNILFSTDGHVRIGDFGLALTLTEEERRSAPKLGASGSVTQTGTIAGTPAYMAPEQFLDGTVDARSDQFAFCVTLYEAVYGVRPFSGETVAALAEVVRGNARHTPTEPGLRVPAWLRALLDRGLAIEPTARFPSMDALVAFANEMLTGRDRRRRIVRTGVLLGAGISAGLLAAVAFHGGAAPEPCTGLESEIATAWNPRTKAALTSGLRTTGAPYVAETADRVTAIFDGYASAWTARLHDACIATRVRGDQSEATLDLRRGCLDAERTELAAVVATLTAADAKTAGLAIDAASRLPSLARCDDLDALRQQRRPTGDAAATLKLHRVDAELANERALMLADRPELALPIAQRLVEETRTLGVPSVRVTALSRLAEAVSESDLPRARAALEEAIETADRAGLDEQRAEVWAQLIITLAGRAQDLPLAKQLMPQAAAAIDRVAAEVEPERDVEWLVAQGSVLAQTGELNDAIAKFRQAERRAAASVGELSPLHLNVFLDLVGIELELHVPQARDDQQRLVAELAKTYGEHHSKTVDARMRLSESLLGAGEGEKATELLRGAVADLVTALGSDDLLVADARTRLAGALLMTNHLADATTENDAALAIRAKHYAPTNLFVIESFEQRGRILGAMGKHAEAIAVLTGVRDNWVKAFGPDYPHLAETELDLGDEAMAINAFTDAETHYRSAIAIKEPLLGKDNPALAVTLLDLGAALVRLHRDREAADVLERALTLQASGNGDPQNLANTRLQLGYALAHTDRKRALELAKLALAEYDRESDRESRDNVLRLIDTVSKK